MHQWGLLQERVTRTDPRRFFGYVCAVKDVFSNRIVGYAISDRMKARIAVNAI